MRPTCRLRSRLHLHVGLAWRGLALGAALKPRVAQAAESKRPNLRFILTDDPGSATLSCYGRKLVPTPHLDRLAREGVRFTRCRRDAAVHKALRGNEAEAAVESLP